jgi:hypothetical protein
VPRGISSGSKKRATEFYPWVPEDAETQDITKYLNIKKLLLSMESLIGI